MVARGKAELLEMGEQGEVIEKRAFIRLVGQDSSLEVIYREPESLVSLYQQKFEQVFGYFPYHAKIELHSLRFRIASPATTEQEETFVSHGQVIDGCGADGMDGLK